MTSFKAYISKLRIDILSFANKIKHLPEYLKKWHLDDAKKKKYRSFRLQKRIKPERLNVPDVRELFKLTLSFLWKNKKLFFGIMAVYSIIYLMLIRAPFMTDSKTIINTVSQVFGENESASFRGNVATLSAVLSTSSTGENAISVSIATLLMSLVYVWTIRQISSKKKVRIRDAYYQSMTPLLSFIMVLLVISIQLIPLGVSSFVYTTARGNNLFISGVEDLTFFIVTLLLGLLSLYWITTSIIALYVVSLPGIYPIQALVIARKLTKFQKFAVFKRIISLTVVLGISYIALLLLVIRFAPDYILYITEGLKIAVLPFIHVYLYKLYRALI